VRVAISGASGFIGSSIVPALEAAGHDVIRLVRRTPTAPNQIEWSPAAGTIDAAALGGIDAIVTLSGENPDQRWTESRKLELRESRVASAGLLARTAAELDPRPSAFVKAGGADAYGDRADEILTEESPLGDGAFLAEVAHAWEAAVEPARSAGIRVVDFRQGIVVGPEGGALRRMLPPFRLGLGGRVGSGRQWWSWVTRDDVAAAYRFVLENDISGPVNLSSPNPVTNIQFVKALGRALGRPTAIPFPRLGAKVLFGERAEATLFPSRRLLPARLLDAGFEFRDPDLEPALRRLLAR
jgi:uncharacterized protein (TIGR01777 family)